MLIILHDASWPTWTQPQQKDAARNVPIRPKPKHLDCLDLRLDRKNQGGELSRERKKLHFACYRALSFSSVVIRRVTTRGKVSCLSKSTCGTTVLLLHVLFDLSRAIHVSLLVYVNANLLLPTNGKPAGLPDVLYQ